MKKNLTEIVFILDRSGSMSGLEADTIGGFNSMIEKQKNAEGEALISTILFDNTSKVIHDRVHHTADRRGLHSRRLHRASGRNRRRNSPHRECP